jgi:Cu-processing system ATP-binding protein
VSLVRAESLTKRYGAVTAVDDLSFQVETGETFALIGPNGAGKTTTLRLLLGLSRPDRGTVRIGPGALPPHDPEARRALGYVPQRVSFPGGRTVREVLEFFAAIRGLQRGAVDRALARVGLEGHARRLASQLSGGYTQRLSLAQALLPDPALLVLDEPTASLDPEATWEFRTLVQGLRREGKTILLCSHLLSEVERVADRVLILVEGRRAGLERLEDLRVRQARASRLAIELAGDPAAALARLAERGLRGEPGTDRRVRIAAMNGDPLHALETLRDAGVAIRSFELERPTLEDLFLETVHGDRHES